MTEEAIIRAWNDEEYRSRLSDEEKAKLPSNPAGEIELTDDDLAQIQGGMDHGGCLDPITTITRGISSLADPCSSAE